MANGTEQRVVRIGIAVAVTAAVVQATVHLVNYWTANLDVLSVNAEHTPFSAMGALAIAATAFGAFLAARDGFARRRTLVLGALLAFLAIDEFFIVHERVGWHLAALLGLSGDWDSVMWPLAYVPLMLTVVVLLVLTSRDAPRQMARLILVGMALLGVAVLAELLSAPYSTAETAGGVVHAVEGAFEEGCELAGWTLIATGLLAWARQRRSSVTSQQAVPVSR